MGGGSRFRDTMEVEMTEEVFADRIALAALCRRHHIRRLSLFGSVLTGSARQDSDLDLLVKHGAPGVKQQLAAVRMLFDWLITGRAPRDHV